MTTITRKLATFVGILFVAMALGKRLASLVRERSFSELPEIVIPIPMHWLSRLMRGTSAAETLARSLAADLRLPFAVDLLRCRRMLKKQGTLLPGERLENVRGAFAINRGYDITGARVLLVDDVITTGATCDSAARALRKAGATSVFAVAVARGTGMRN